jgi:hypothetical protein
MSDLKKEKDVKKVIEEENKGSNPLSQLREAAGRAKGDSPTFTFIISHRNTSEALLYFDGVAKILGLKPKVTMAALIEMVKDSSVTLSQEAVNDINRLIEAGDIAGLIARMLSMPEFKDKLLRMLAA